MTGIPFVRAFDFAYGVPDRLSDRITRVIAENPGPFTFTGSGSYLVTGSRGVAVIDPGPDDRPHRDALLAAASAPITHILVTHTHRDHCGGTAALKDATGARTFGFGPHGVAPDRVPPALDEGADFDFVPDHLIDDGDRVVLGGATLTAVHTPGHCANHLCIALEEEAALFTGDHVMGWSTTVIAPPDGHMADYMAALDRLLAREDRRYLPTHGAPIDDPHDFVRALKAHRLARDAAILAALDGTPRSAMDITRIVYRDTDPSLHPAAALNVTAHLAPHVAAGRVRQVGDSFVRAELNPADSE